MGSMRQRGRIWWIKYYRDGVAHEESSRSRKKKVAVDLLRLREGDIAKGVPVSAKVGRLRFDEAVRDVLTDYEVNRRRSADAVERRIRRHLAPFFGGRRMSAIDTPLIRTYIAERQAPVPQDDGNELLGASNAEINRELAILKRAYRLAKQAGKLLHAPHIPMLQENNVRQGFFEREQFESVKKKLPEALRPVVTFAYVTGWRVPSEVLTLKWAGIDCHAEVIRLEPGEAKNREGRTFPYGALPELRSVIETQWEAHETLLSAGTICPFVFHRNGKRIRSFDDAWRNACRDAGVPGKVPHDFRRTAVRNLVRAGVPEKTAMLLTGHKTRSVFDRYDIVNEQDLREAVRKLAAAGTKKGQSGDSADSGDESMSVSA